MRPSQEMQHNCQCCCGPAQHATHVLLLLLCDRLLPSKSAPHQMIADFLLVTDCCCCCCISGTLESHQQQRSTLRHSSESFPNSPHSSGIRVSKNDSFKVLCRMIFVSSIFRLRELQHCYRAVFFSCHCPVPWLPDWRYCIAFYSLGISIKELNL